GHQRAAPRRVARVEPNGQVAQLLEHGYGADVEGEAGGGLEGADAALAQDDVGVAVAQHVLGGLQELGYGGAHAALEEHGLARLTDLGKQREVLAVTRAYLQHVGAGGYLLHQFGGRDLGDDGHARTGARLLEDLEPFLLQPLEG